MSIPNSINTNQEGMAVSTNDTNAPAANTAAVLTYAAGGANINNVLAGVFYSYSGAPTGGNLQISDGANVIFNLDITAAGPGFVPFDPPKKGTANTAMTITLAAGGAGISGKVNATHWTEGPGP